MLCFKCLDAMTKGDLEGLKEMRSECHLYVNKQCKHMAPEDTMNGRIQDANVRLFPDKLKKIFASGNAKFGAILLALAITAYSFSSVNKPQENVSVNEDISTHYTSLMGKAQELRSTGHVADAFDLVSSQFVMFPQTFSNNEKQEMRDFLLSLDKTTEVFSPSAIYETVGIESPPPSEIVKVQGVVSFVDNDPSFGYVAYVSDTEELTKESLMVVQPTSHKVVPGDEVIFLCVPEFINIAFPLRVSGWVQV